MSEGLHSPAHARELIRDGKVTPARFRAALTALPLAARDAWLDEVFELDELPDDTPRLPEGCVPYLPCPVDAVLAALELAQVRPEDVFVDLGSGLGRAMVLARLATGASSLGIELQPGLVRASHALARRLELSRVEVVAGDAATLTAHLTLGSVFFLYCPFSGERLAPVLRALEQLSHRRPIRLCLVDLEAPDLPWLERLPGSEGQVAVYRSRCPTSTRPPSSSS